jgi:YidC/Oxa1 family membrane protein insertase
VSDGGPAPAVTSDFMEKRVLLAIVLSFIVLYGYQALFPPPKPQPRFDAPPAAPSQAAPVNQPVNQPVERPVPQSAASAPAAAVPQPVVADSAERDVVVEDDAVRAVFSTRGGVLKSWQLKRYRTADGTPLDLVPARVPPGSPRPFTLSVGDAAVDAAIAQALFKPSADSLVTNAPATLTFGYQDAAGLVVRKAFAFSPDKPYEVAFTATVTQKGSVVNPVVKWGPALGTGVVSSGMTYAPSSQPILYRDREVTRVGFDKIPEYRSIEGPFGFAGVDDHYFLSATVASGQTVNLQFEPIAVPVEASDRGLQFVSWAVRYQTPPSNARFFMGPKDFDVLASTDRDLVRAIDFGLFSWLVVPLLRALKWVNGYVGNYGWSIIILTILINLAMFPLRHKSVVSMRKMQDLQPEVKAIQDRYAKLKMSDPARQKMNVELMNLYRERGVNPASGCVPMLLTMPVLFAFYSMLSVAIELRGAPFIGWIKDLSVYDPLFITPVLMGLTQFVQTKMTPATGDPTQQKMMLFMPLIFMTMFIWAPSGLVLYWTVSNLWAIGQQAVTNRLIGPAPQRTVSPAAERRLKQAGGGKSDAAKERK